MSDATLKIDGYDIRVLDGPYLRAGIPTPEARDFASQLIGMLDKMRAFAAKRYLAIYNETWREEHDPVLTEQEFCSRLVQPSIVLYDEIGSAVVYFGDSDMFAGHSIEVSIDSGEIAFASMVG
jgi:hypothetical protein